MANRVYIIPRRNDFPGKSIQLLDLYPNTSQRNSTYDGAGQTGYLGAGIDTRGTTARSGDSYVSGSTNTLLVAADDIVVADTTGGGNDCEATQTATFGLAAYLREHVQRAGAGGTHLTVANANAMALAIMARVEAGSVLTLAGINAALAGGAGGVAGTELTVAGGSLSFGTIADILHILSGEVYVSRAHTIVTTAVPVFIDLAARDVLVAAQDTATTGITFVSVGRFLTTTETGYRAKPTLVRNGSVNASVAAGLLSTYKGVLTFTNPSFSYTAAGVTEYMVRAANIGEAALATTGAAAGIAVYDHLGNVL